MRKPNNDSRHIFLTGEKCKSHEVMITNVSCGYNYASAFEYQVLTNIIYSNTVFIDSRIHLICGNNTYSNCQFFDNTGTSKRFDNIKNTVRFEINCIYLGEQSNNSLFTNLR